MVVVGADIVSFVMGVLCYVVDVGDERLCCCSFLLCYQEELVLIVAGSTCGSTYDIILMVCTREPNALVVFLLECLVPGAWGRWRGCELTG